MSRTRTRNSTGLADRLDPAAIAHVVAGRMARRWHLDVAAEYGQADRVTATEARTAPDQAEDGGDEAADVTSADGAIVVPFGSYSQSILEAGWDRIHPATLALRRWADPRSVAVDDPPRRVFGAMQGVPERIVIPDLTTAAAIAGDPYPDLVATSRRRAPELLARLNRHAATAHLASILRSTSTWSDLDFGILLDVSDWFAVNHLSAVGLTPRQVPIPGVQAKWLNGHHDLVCKLAGMGSLHLAAPHPARIHFTYLDPEYRDNPNNRIHDSASVDDTVTLPYRPRVVIISENKDTAVCFPLLAGAVSVEGVGKGGGTVAKFDWIKSADLVLYWGDIDADGFEILDGFIAAGIPAKPLLMDTATWDRYGHLGTNRYPDGRLIPAKPRPAAVPWLTAAQRQLYLDLCDPARSDFRRLEQERIPLADALLAAQQMAAV